MFDQSLLGSTHASARKPYSAIASFGLQTALLLLLIAVPLFHPGAIEMLQPMAAPLLFAGVPMPRPPVELSSARHTGAANEFRYSPHFSAHPVVAGPADATADQPDATACPPYCGSSPTQGIPLPLGGPPPPVTLEKPKPVAPTRIHVSEVSPGYLIQKVQPTYPSLAIATRTEGEVRLEAIIGRDGSIQNLRLMSGHPMLAAAALAAVKQWRYRPHLLNGEPVEVETTVVVHFTLAR